MPKEITFSSDVLLEEYSEHWLKKNEGELSIKTVTHYKYLTNRIYMGLGHIPLNKLTAQHIDKFCEILKQNGTNEKTHKPLSDETVRHYLRYISVVLSQAVTDRLISCNYASFTKIKKKKAINTPSKAKDRCLTLKEIETLVDSMPKYSFKWQVIILALLVTGMRRGELFGLEWSDIDFNNNIIDIHRTSQYIPEFKALVTKLPKNETSIRKINIPVELTEMFSKFQKLQAEQKKSPLWKIEFTTMDEHCNEYICANDRIFTQTNGLPMFPDSLNTWITRYCNDTGFKKFTPHGLRHTFISIMLAKGVPIADVSDIAGHSQISTTLNVYAHAMKTEETKKKIFQIMGKTTIKTESRGNSQSNSGGSTSKNENLDGRDLVTIEELKRYSNKHKKKYGGSVIAFIDNYDPFFMPKFDSPRHPLFKITGSSFAIGLPNNTDIREVYKDHLKPVIHKSVVRDFIEKQQEELKDIFDSGKKYIPTENNNDLPY